MPTECGVSTVRRAPDPRRARAATTMCGECGARPTRARGPSSVAAAGSGAPPSKRQGLRAGRSGQGGGAGWRCRSAPAPEWVSRIVGKGECLI